MKLSTLIKGLLLILVGVILLLINFGYGSWNSLQQISRWWPVLLIIIGLGIFGWGRIPRWLAGFLIVGMVIGVSTYMIWGEKNNDYKKSTVSVLTISPQQYPQVSEGNLKIDYGGGKIAISPGSPQLLKADFNNEKINQRIDSNDRNLQVYLGKSQQNWPSREENIDTWRIQISPQLTWNLDINAGAVEENIDLKGIPFNELKCDIGAGSMNIILGKNAKSSNFSIDGGASNIVLHIPSDTGVHLQLNGALNENNLDEIGWIKAGNYYTSPNYQQAEYKIEGDINLSVGNLNIVIDPSS